MSLSVTDSRDVEIGTSPQHHAARVPDGVPPCDVEALINRCMGKAAFAARMVAKFQNAAPTDIEQMAAALADGDHTTLGELAHSFKGVAASLSAERLRSLAEQLQTIAEGQDLSDAEACIDGLREELQRFGTYLAND